MCKVTQLRSGTALVSLVLVSASLCFDQARKESLSLLFQVGSVGDDEVQGLGEDVV